MKNENEKKTKKWRNKEKEKIFVAIRKFVSNVTELTEQSREKLHHHRIVGKCNVMYVCNVCKH